MTMTHKSEYPHEYPGKFDRPDIHEIKVGDVVYVRAIVTDVEIEAWTTRIAVKEYCSGYPMGTHTWKADNVNSVDIWKRRSKRERARG